MTSKIVVNNIEADSGINTVTFNSNIQGNLIGDVTGNINSTGVTTVTSLRIGTGTSISSPATNVLTLGTNNVERVRINSSGNLGIGTNNPQARLSVGAGSLVDANVPIQISSQSATGLAYYGANNNGSYGALFGYDRNGFSGGVIRVIGSTDNISFVVNNTTVAGTFDSNGRLGIGVTIPDSLLHLKSTTGNVRHTIETPDTYQAYTNYSAANSEFSIGYIRNSGVDHSFRFCAADGLSSNEIMRIDSVNSRISIGGNASPNQKLTLTDGNISLYTTTYSAGEVTHKTITSYAKNGVYSNLYNADAEIAFGKVNGFDVDWTHGGFIAFKTTDNNRDTAPLERLRIDQLGRLTTPYQPTFIANKTNGQTLTVTVDNVIAFDSEVVDIGGNYASNRFTAPVAGNYQFQVACMGTVGSGGYVRTGFKKNGGSYYGLTYATITVSGYESLVTSSVINLAANDYVEVVIYPSMTSFNLDNTGTFSGYLIG